MQIRVYQQCVSPGRQVARATKFLRWRIIFLDPQYGTCIVAPKILRQLLHFWKTYGLLTYTSVTLCAFVSTQGQLCLRHFVVVWSPAHQQDATLISTRRF